MCGPPYDDYVPNVGNDYAVSVRLAKLYSYRLHGRKDETEKEYYKRMEPKWRKEN